MKSWIRLLPTTVYALALIALPATAHEETDQPEGTAVLHVGEHEEHGSYLVDQEEMALYLFEADIQGGNGSEPQSNCHNDCAIAWPPLRSAGEPQVHDDLNPELLGTIPRENGETQVTYNGWPLYYFASDMDPGHTRGHDIETHGAEWYLVSPEGEKAGDEH